MFTKLTNTSNQELDINISEIAVHFEGTITLTNGFNITLDEKSRKKLELIMYPKTRTKDSAPKDGMQELFDKLHKLTGGKGKAILTLQREKKLNDLLTKHRFTEEDLIRAATNIGNDAFLQGANDGNGGKGKRYGNVNFLLRPDKAAQYAEEDGKKKNRMF